jgi:hypothetical protein
VPLRLFKRRTTLEHEVKAIAMGNRSDETSTPAALDNPPVRPPPRRRAPRLIVFSIRSKRLGLLSKQDGVGG